MKINDCDPHPFLPCAGCLDGTQDYRESKGQGGAHFPGYLGPVNLSLYSFHHASCMEDPLTSETT